MGRAGSSMFPTWTLLDIIRWERFRPATDRSEVSNQLGHVVSIFGCESVDFGFFDSLVFG